jgi:hypothetical protein
VVEVGVPTSEPREVAVVVVVAAAVGCRARNDDGCRYVSFAGAALDECHELMQKKKIDGWTST